MINRRITLLQNFCLMRPMFTT